MRFSRSVLMVEWAYTLYRWFGEQGICEANQTVVRPCSFSFALMRLPMCMSLISVIKKVWNLFLA